MAKCRAQLEPHTIGIVTLVAETQTSRSSCATARITIGVPSAENPATVLNFCPCSCQTIWYTFELHHVSVQSIHVFSSSDELMLGRASEILTMAQWFSEQAWQPACSEVKHDPSFRALFGQRLSGSAFTKLTTARNEKAVVGLIIDGVS